jgi:hypothetical protein
VRFVAAHTTQNGAHQMAGLGADIVSFVVLAIVVALGSSRAVVGAAQVEGLVHGTSEPFAPWTHHVTM